jgi:hypothetical protein
VSDLTLLFIDMIVVMIRIGLILQRKCRLLSLRYPRLLATGSGKHPRHNDSFIRDQRGTAAFEMPIVWLFLMTCLLLPLADIAIAGFQFISAWEALRAFGQYVQLPINQPPDFTNTGAWISQLPTKGGDYPISNLKVLCGDTNNVCSANNSGFPRYYSYTTTVTLKPMVLARVLCSSTCSFTLPYSERFQ